MIEQGTEVPRPLSPRSMARLSSEARKELHRLTTPQPIISAAAFVFQYVAVVAAGFAIERSGIYWLYPVAVVFISARMHSLYLLNHDASHSSLFKSRRVNKIVSTWLANLPFLHHPETWSFIQWRAAHLPHHSKLCTEKDWYWIFRRTEGVTEREITRPELYWRITKFGLMSSLGWIRAKQRIFNSEGVFQGEIPHWKVFFLPFRGDREMRNERILSWAFMAAALTTITLLGGWRVVLLYWIVPMYTVFPVLLELAEMTEHHWHAAPEDMVGTTTSTIPGIFTKLFVSEMNRTLHREHHLISKVPCYKLLPLHRLLVANGLVPPAVRGLGRTILNKPRTVELALRRARTQPARSRSATTAARDPAQA